MLRGRIDIPRVDATVTQPRLKPSTLPAGRQILVSWREDENAFRFRCQAARPRGRDSSRDTVGEYEQVVLDDDLVLHMTKALALQ